MGIIERIKQLFSQTSEKPPALQPEEEFQQEEYASQYNRKKDKIANEAMDALLSNQEPVVVSSQSDTAIISEYDVGDVDIDHLTNDDSTDNSNKNVIEYESLDTIVEHLENAEIIGDIPTEVTFDSP